MASARQSTFDLLTGTRPGYGSPGSEPYKTERKFLDFVLDGVSLYDSVASERDLASTLWIDPPVPNEILKSARRLLLLEPGDLPSGRVSLYTCPECGDLGCGGITVSILRRNGDIVWCDFGYENNYEEGPYLEPFRSLGPFHFARLSYEARLAPLLLQYS
jgi:hypothetical protein